MRAIIKILVKPNWNWTEEKKKNFGFRLGLIYSSLFESIDTVTDYSIIAECGLTTIFKQIYKFNWYFIQEYQDLEVIDWHRTQLSINF